jgi:hypothetical protein
MARSLSAALILVWFVLAVGCGSSESDARDATPPPRHYTSAEVEERAEGWVNDFRHFGAECTASRASDDAQVWDIRCTAIERICDGLPLGDELAHCLQAEECDEALSVVARDRCRDVAKNVSLLFSARYDYFIDLSDEADR